MPIQGTYCVEDDGLILFDKSKLKQFVNCNSFAQDDILAISTTQRFSITFIRLPLEMEQ